MSRARKRQSKLMTVPTLFEIKIYLKPQPTSLDDTDITFLYSIFHALSCYKGTPSSSVIAEQIVKGWFSIGTDGAAYSQFLSPCLLCQWPWSWSSNSSFRREEGTMGSFCSQFTHIQQPVLYCHGYKGARRWATPDCANPVSKLWLRLYGEEWKYPVYVAKNKALKYSRLQSWLTCSLA